MIARLSLGIIFGLILAFFPSDVRAEGGVIINEILPAPKDKDWNNNGQIDTKEEWIELFNSGDYEIDLSDWSIYEKPVNKYFPLTGFKIKPKEYLVIYKNQINFALNNDTDEIWLVNKDVTVSTVNYGVSGKNVEYNYSYNFDGINWQWSQSPTPGAKNTISLPPKEEKTTKKQTSTSSTGSKSTKNSVKTSKSSAISGENESGEEEVLGESSTAQLPTGEIKIGGQKSKSNNVFGIILLVLGTIVIISSGLYLWKKEQVVQFIQKTLKRPKN